MSHAYRFAYNSGFKPVLTLVFGAHLYPNNPVPAMSISQIVSNGAAIMTSFASQYCLYSSLLTLQSVANSLRIVC
jgi:hypothetical protein